MAAEGRAENMFSIKTFILLLCSFEIEVCPFYLFIFFFEKGILPIILIFLVRTLESSKNIIYNYYIFKIFRSFIYFLFFSFYQTKK